MKSAKFFFVMLAMICWLVGFAPKANAAGDPGTGPGGPILVVTTGPSPFGKYYAEILRTEGLNSFAVADIASVSATTLAAYDVVLLAKMPLTAPQATMFTTWVNGGGNLIAMAPDAQLASLLGLTRLGTQLSNAYLLVNTSTNVGNGIVGQTIQYHGAADLYTLNGATSLATLYSNATTATTNPAVTLRSVGSGKAAAFAYDFAPSIIYTRQGNPAWASQERDGNFPIRSDDKFYGNLEGDVQPDWVDLTKVAIPQADEQQRFLANLILQMNISKKPLPRFWYFPNGKKAVIIMTGDDHANGGTVGRFDQFKSLSTAGCSVANWECVRGTSYVFNDTPITNAQAVQYNADGFEISLHINTDCSDFTASSLEGTYVDQLSRFQTQFPGLPAPITQRHHCIVWSDWTSAADVQFNHGMRLDTSYYWWPPSWVNDVPGIFTGSVMPMRFARLDGTMVDVFEAASQMTDESGQTYPMTVNTLLDRAIGTEAYYGAYTINAHTDLPTELESDTTVAAAQARNLPIVSARQMLTWIDGRNASSFGGLSWASNKLNFTVTKDAGANGLQGMLPTHSGTFVLSSITRSGASVPLTVSVVKGVEYGFFSADAGAYVATYGTSGITPTVTSTTPASGATGVSIATKPSAVFNEPMDPTTVTSSTVELRTSGGTLVSAAIAYDASAQAVTITPSSSLALATTYTVTLKGGATDPRIKDGNGTALSANVTWTFTTSSTVPASTGFSSTAVPGTPATTDTAAVELGVKFKSDANGFVTGVRFYKGTANTGTHVGNLWTSTGTLLGTATFTGETATGWQQVTFPSPVAITAGTVYVASYFAPAGHYAADSAYFASTGVDNAPIHLLQDGVSGGNGVFGYSSTSTFPSSSFNATNYWVDVAFAASTTADTTPPTVTAVSPANGATGASLTSAITATFSEALTAATVATTTFDVKNAASVAVTGTVSYNAATNTATFTPSAALTASTTYTATIHGGATDPRIKDAAGNALAANFVFSFTTGTTSTTTTSGFGSTAVPASPAVNDPAAVELGVKFKSDVNGFISGVRFYKGAGNTGTHIGNLWSSAGTKLATATFTAETATGWQLATFSSPVAITAGTIYVASYFAPAGHYAGDSNYFASTGVDNAPIHLLQNGVSGGNGVYAYGSASLFPSSTYQSTNYWVDVVFTSGGAGDPTPPTVSATTPSNGSTSVALASPVTATFSEALDASTISSSTFELRNAANALVTGTVTYNAGSNSMSFTPSAALAASTTYTATLKGGATDPRVKDTAGNAMAANFTWTFTTGVVGGVCAAPANAIVGENCLTGNPSSEWDISGAGDLTIQGFTTQISVNRGSAIQFKVSTTASAYRFDIYRMGYYGGMGARKVATFTPSATLPQNQPNCLSDAATGLVDCGNWGVSGSWTVPATAVSGIYFAKVTRTDNGGASHIFFVVRNDASTSTLLFQTSDTTWQAYNEYGGNSLYVGSPVGRAYKVSYNRPFTTRSVANGQDWVFNAEYPMIRWLESNGYDVSYFSGVDAERTGSMILSHKTFLSVGHDEYWSAGQRANVEAARAAGINLAFFSGNEVFWKTRWENSIDGSGTAYRTLVAYKDTHANTPIDPTGTWTGTWRDPRFSPPEDGGKPENALTGTIFMNNDTGVEYSITVPEADGKMRLWRNTNIATQAAGGVVTLPVGTLGYEWDADLDNGFRPAGSIRMSSTTLTTSGALQDFGSTYAEGTVTHNLTLYKHSSGAKVFGAGTIQWSWGLDSNHDRGNLPVDVRMQQATANVLSDLGAQPATLMSGLVMPTASTDTVKPTSTITSPTAGASVAPGSPITITGTASDTGGGVVGGVEVSVDGGTTWHMAAGRANWTYAWSPASLGTVVIKTRATDDSANTETPGAGVSVTVAAQACPCSIWSSLAIPGTPSDSDTGAVNVGLKFTSEQSGSITGVRFYKGATNTGTHIGTLWTAAGVQLATATFTGESASGWQQVSFASPVAITANTVYVVSYLAPNGHYAGDNAYFATAATDNPPLHALKEGTSGSNGVYVYGSATAFPTQSFQSSNYWVDVVFTTSGGTTTDTTPPTVTTVSPASGATGVSTATTVTATFSEAMNASTITASTVKLATSTGTAVTATVGYNAATNVATLTPSAALAASTAYTLTVTGGAAGVTDAAGNALAANRTSTFTTAAAGDTTPPTVTANTPASGATGVSRTTTVTATFSEAMTVSTISSSTFSLATSTGTAVPAAVSYNATTRVVTLTPTAALAGSTAYTATVTTGVKDAAGNALAANKTWTFTTVAADTTPPTVSAISPASGATNASRTVNITATFSEAMDASTINTTNFVLTTSTGTVVAAAVSYNANTRVATLNPTPTLGSLTTYTVTVKTGVKDSAGNALATARTWTFRTSL